MRPANGVGRGPLAPNSTDESLPELEHMAAETAAASDANLTSDAEHKPPATWAFPEDFASRCTAVVLLLCLYSALCIFLPTTLGIRANPAVMPDGAKPTWGFLFLYEFVRLVPPLVGALAPAVMLVVLGALPFLDRNPSREPRRRVFALLLGLAAVVAVAALTYLGWVA